MSQYYKKYMKRREEEKPSYIKLFIGAFLLIVAFFFVVAIHLTSSVDTTIGENDEGDIKESGLGVKHLIDSRLRFIQMEDVSAPKQKDSSKTDIEQYGKTIKDEQEAAYKGKYENSYGYNQTQQTQPYSQTYNNTKTQYNNYGASSSYSNGSSSSTTSSSNYANKTYSVPTPTAPVRTNSSTPAHNIQKNLAPTGM